MASNFNTSLTLDVTPFLNALKKAAAESGIAADKIEAEFNGIDPKITIDTTKIGAEGTKAAQSFGTKFKDAIKGGGLGEAFAGGLIGGGVSGIVSTAAGAIVGGFKSAVDAGLGFETSLASLQAVTGASGATLDDLGNRAKDLAAQFGGDVTTQLGSFQTILSKFGPDLAKAPEALGKVSENVNILAKAAGLDAKQAVDALSNSMLQFGVDASDPARLAEESGRFINVLAASAKVGAAEIPQVAEAVLQAGVAAKGANLSFEETNAAIQQLAIGGKVGSEAGVSLRNVIGLLIKQSGPGSDALKGVGLSAEGLGKTLTTKGLAAALEELRGGMDKLGSDAEKAAFKATLFGTENASAAGILLGGVNNIKLFTEGVTGTSEATDQAAVNMSTLSERFGRIRSGIQVALIDGFQKVAPIINGFIDVIGQIAPYLGIAVAGVIAYVIALNAGAIASGIMAAATAVMNAVIAVSPIGWFAIAITGATIAAVALTDALTQTAEEELENAEAQKKVIEQQIKTNKERQVTVNTTKTLVDQFKDLAEKTNRTKKEEEQLLGIQRKLDAQYPDLIDQTKSFKDNLKGVEEIGKLVTSELGKLTEEGQRLAENLKQVEKTTLFLKRNVQLSTLIDEATLGPWEDLITFNVELRKALGETGRAADQFAQDIYKARNVEEVIAAQNKILDVVNKLAPAFANAEESERFQKILAGITATASAARVALGEVVDVASDAANTPPPPPPQVKEVTGLKEALEAYAQLEKTVKSELDAEKQRVSAQQKLGELTEAQARERTASAERLAVLRKQLFAQQQLQANLDRFGLFISTDYKFKDPNDPENKQLITKAADVFTNLLQERLKETPLTATVKVFTEFIGPREFVGPIDQLTADERAAFARRSDAIKDALLGDTSAAEAIVSQSKSLAERTALAFTNGLRTSEESNPLLRMMDSVGRSLQPFIDEQKAAFAEAAAAGEAAYGSLAQVASASFVQSIAAGEGAAESAAKVAFDVLDMLVPIWSAQIVAGSLATPQSIASGGTAGIVQFTLLLGLLKGAVSAARAASGFSEGGYTGNMGVNDVAGVVHGREFVLNAGATQKHRALMEHMNRGGDPRTFFADNNGSKLDRIANLLESIPTERMTRTAAEIQVGFDSYLYERDRKRASLRRLAF